MLGFGDRRGVVAHLSNRSTVRSVALRAASSCWRRRPAPVIDDTGGGDGEQSSCGGLLTVFPSLWFSWSATAAGGEEGSGSCSVMVVILAVVIMSTLLRSADTGEFGDFIVMGGNRASVIVNPSI